MKPESGIVNLDPEIAKELHESTNTPRSRALRAKSRSTKKSPVRGASGNSSIGVSDDDGNKTTPTRTGRSATRSTGKGSSGGSGGGRSKSRGKSTSRTPTGGSRSSRSKSRGRK